MSLENNIKEWVNYDNHINELNNKIKDLKDKRNIKEDEIHSLLRTKDMFELGIIEETKNIINKYGFNLPLLETIGYKEAKDVIKENLKIEEAIELTTTKTIQFAKRQKTWFRNKNNPIWLNNKNLLKDAIIKIEYALG